MINFFKSIYLTSKNVVKKNKLTLLISHFSMFHNLETHQIKSKIKKKLWNINKTYSYTFNRVVICCHFYQHMFVRLLVWSDFANHFSEREKQKLLMRLWVLLNFNLGPSQTLLLGPPNYYLNSSTFCFMLQTYSNIKTVNLSFLIFVQRK